MKSAILFLHGWGMNPGVFLRQRDIFGDDLMVIAPDIYDIVSAESDELLLDQIVDSISDAVRSMGVLRLIIFGWSFGGAIAVKIAERLDDITKGIVLCGFSPVFKKCDKNRYGIREPAIKKLKGRLECSPGAAIKEFLPLVMYGDDAKDFDAVKDIVMSRIKDYKRDALVRTLSILEDGDFSDDVGRIKKRALIIHGSNDKLCHKKAVDAMAKTISDCSVTIIEGGSHIPFFTESAAFNKILKEFIEEIG
ncbi:alpha/beta fold hydrolase [Thermodesulfobacteriota bacterium]